MNCTHTAELLPLYVADDLPPAKAEIVRDHLRECSECQTLAEEFSESREWLQSAAVADLPDTFYEDLRADVWRSIDTEKARFPFWANLFPRLNWWPVLASAAALLVFAFGLFTLRHDTGSIGLPTPPAPVAVVKPTPEIMPLSGAVAKVEIKSPKAKLTRRQDTLPLIRVPLPVAPLRVPELARIDQPAIEQGPEMIRIEIQTADPNVRIIWLAPKEEAPLADPNISTIE
jgi:anti-sigma factor RsiW